MPPSEPDFKRAIAYFDGQNLFRCAMEAFGYHFPNYDPLRLATRVCKDQGWDLREVKFYTGVPPEHENRMWHTFWANKFRAMGRDKIKLFKREIRYRDRSTTWPGEVRLCLPGQPECPVGTPLCTADGNELPEGTEFRVRIGQEKGVDVRLALDVASDAYLGNFEIGLIFSQDQDLSELSQHVKQIANKDDRWMQLASAFPLGDQP